MAGDLPRQNAVGSWQTFSESPSAVKAMFAGVVINRLGGFLSIFLVLFMASRGHSPTESAAALGAYGLGGVVGTLLGGVLVERLGARTATVVSMSGSAVLTVSLLYLPGYLVLLAMVALCGLVGQIFRPAAATLLSELTPESRQVMIFAMYRFGLNLGTTACPLLGFALYYLGRHHYTLVFWGEALVGLGYTVLALCTLPAKQKRTREAAAAEAQPAGSYLEVLRDRRYAMYLLAAFVNAVVYVQYLSTLPLDIKAHGMALIWYTVAVSLNALMVIGCELPLTRFTQHWPVRISVGTTFALVGLGMASYGLPFGPAVVVLGTLLWTTGEIVGGPATFAYPAMAGPARLRSRYIGSFQFAYASASAVGPVIGGLLFTALGHRVWPVVAVASLVAALLVVTTVRQPAPAVRAEPVEAQPAGTEPAELPAGMLPPAG
ncbi:MAG TPA: MFS transporter [Jatrophihabitans sp.]|nr:MFS transporter [Jatrophihabitans sp.]